VRSTAPSRHGVEAPTVRSVVLPTSRSVPSDCGPECRDGVHTDALREQREVRQRKCADQKPQSLCGEALLYFTLEPSRCSQRAAEQLHGMQMGMSMRTACRRCRGEEHDRTGGPDPTQQCLAVRLSPLREDRRPTPHSGTPTESLRACCASRVGLRPSSAQALLRPPTRQCIHGGTLHSLAPTPSLHFTSASSRPIWVECLFHFMAMCCLYERSARKSTSEELLTRMFVLQRKVIIASSFGHSSCHPLWSSFSL